jgi:hypothetical protein
VACAVDLPETNCLELVRAVNGGELALEDIIELEQEALVENGQHHAQRLPSDDRQYSALYVDGVAARDRPWRRGLLVQLSGSSEAGDVVLFLR